MLEAEVSETFISRLYPNKRLSTNISPKYLLLFRPSKLQKNEIFSFKYTSSFSDIIQSYKYSTRFIFWDVSFVQKTGFLQTQSPSISVSLNFFFSFHYFPKARVSPLIFYFCLQISKKEISTLFSEFFLSFISSFYLTSSFDLFFFLRGSSFI